MSMVMPEPGTSCPGGTRRARVVDALERRRLLGAGAAGLLGAAGCAGRRRAGQADRGRVIEHAFGRTEVSGTPRRLVVLGYTDVEVALALGVVPVGYTDFFGTGLNPWARARLDGAEPAGFELTDGVPLEKVLSLRPDLILASDGITRAEYDRLSASVPVVGPFHRDGAYGTPWRDHTRRSARVLDRVRRGERVIAALERRYAEARSANPEFARSTLTFSWPIAPDYYAYYERDPRMQVLQELGFSLTPDVRELQRANPGDFFATLSAEQVGRLDADVLLAQSYSAEQRRDALVNRAFGRLPVARRGGVVWLPESLADGLAFGTVLSVPYVLDRLVPLLRSAVATVR